MNHMKTSSGLLWRYRLMFSWKLLWSTVLTSTVRLSSDCFSYAAKAWANAFLGTGSEAFEPIVTVFPSPPGPPPHAASSDGSAIAPAPAAAPRRRFRREIRWPDRLAGTAEPLNGD